MTFKYNAYEQNIYIWLLFHYTSDLVCNSLFHLPICESLLIGDFCIIWIKYMYAYLALSLAKWLPSQTKDIVETKEFLPCVHIHLRKE